MPQCGIAGDYAYSPGKSTSFRQSLRQFQILIQDVSVSPTAGFMPDGPFVRLPLAILGNPSGYGISRAQKP
jgi:hypothetical protein